MIYLLVDASPLIYAVYSAQGHLATSKGEPTGLRYGYLRSVRSYAEKVKADHIINVFDMPGKILKAEGLTTYKSNRVMTDEKRTMYSQVPQLKELIELTYWSMAWAEGYEADDVIGYCAKKIEQQGHQVVISSSDNDMCNAITENVRVWIPPKSKTKEKEYYKDRSWVKDKWGVWPEQLAAFRAFAGDKSDNIQPVSTDEARIGRVRDMLNTMGPPSIALAGLFLNQEEEDLWEMNYRASCLATPPSITRILGKNDPEALKAAFEAMEAKSMIDKVDQFTRTI